MSLAQEFKLGKTAGKTASRIMLYKNWLLCIWRGIFTCVKYHWLEAALKNLDILIGYYGMDKMNNFQHFDKK